MSYLRFPFFPNFFLGNDRIFFVNTATPPWLSLKILMPLDSSRRSEHFRLVILDFRFFHNNFLKPTFWCRSYHTALLHLYLLCVDQSGSNFYLTSQQSGSKITYHVRTPNKDEAQLCDMIYWRRYQRLFRTFQLLNNFLETALRYICFLYVHPWAGYSTLCVHSDYP